MRLRVLLGALLAHKDKEIDQAGFDLEREFLKKADLDLTAASQSDGAGGNAFFTAHFMVRYLTFMSARKDFADFRARLETHVKRLKALDVNVRPVQ